MKYIVSGVKEAQDLTPFDSYVGHGSNLLRYTAKLAHDYDVCKQSVMSPVINQFNTDRY